MATIEQIAYADQCLRKLLDYNIHQRIQLNEQIATCVTRCAYAEAARISSTVDGLTMAEAALRDELRRLRLLGKYVVDAGGTWTPAESSLT